VAIYIETGEVLAIVGGLGALGAFLLWMRHKERWNRWAKQMERSEPIVRLEQLTHPHMVIDGAGPYIAKFTAPDGKRHRRYCPSIEYARREMERQTANGATDVRADARAVDEWRSWKIPPQSSLSAR
jgi:hypothetical protein